MESKLLLQSQDSHWPVLSMESRAFTDFKKILWKLWRLYAMRTEAWKERLLVGLVHRTG